MEKITESINPKVLRNSNGKVLLLSNCAWCNRKKIKIYDSFYKDVMLVSAAFYFSDDSPWKTIKNDFYFNWKYHFILEIFKFLLFFPFPFFPDSKGQKKLKLFMTSWIA